ncbi:XrtA system polysaccharide chain length determinant [Sphingomonas sp. NFR15]|uniref:XrtA system polysaccharide chain length determinant n=1 Tax=Sphingomonas sp. NFR15 TaxID=1566282 RepID=UPI0008820642|nr:XrtA system polysaccharide chain length determinant [Sphingomonas sp. NFR15]SDA29191.1 polysaccharide chain length determinant protein, PEP-CTERM locus subfamily [Sphingomonas sp. NFR15]
MNGLYDELRVALHAVWMRRWIALGVAWAVAIVGWLFVAQIPSSYESTARVFAQMQTLLPAAVGISPADQQKNLDTVRQTLTSADNLEKVVRGTDLANTVATDKDVADRVAALQRAVKITSEQDNIFTISVSQRSPKVARQVVQKLLDLFVEQNLSGDKAETTQTLQFLDQQLAQKQKQLSDAEAKREDFQNRYLGSLPGTGSIADRMAAARSQMAQVDGDLAAAQSGLAVINGQMAGTPASVPGAGGTAGSAGPARARLNAIQGQLSDARARGYTEQHPDVIALKSQLAAAQAAARSEPLVGGSAAAGSSNPLYLQLKANQADKQAQVAALMSRKRQLQGDIDAISAKLTGDSGAMQEQSQIERDYQVLKDSYDKLLSDRESVRLRGQAQSQTDAIKFSVLDQPSAPRVPTSPNRPLLLTGVLLAALVMGAGAAFAMTQVQTTFPTAKRLEAATGLPVIGSIGETVTKLQTAQRRQQLGYFGGGLAALVVAWVALLGVEMLQRGLAA